jgi:hypothetical protein
MYVFECTYTNYFGETKPGKAMFQLSKPEIFEIAANLDGGFESAGQKLIDSNDDAAIFSSFTKIIAKAYGEISQDGSRFVKSPEASKAFMETPIYEQLFEKFITDPEFQRKFIAGIVPSDSKEQVLESLTELMTTK